MNRFRRILCLTAALLLIFSLCGCGTLLDSAQDYAAGLVSDTQQDASQGIQFEVKDPADAPQPSEESSAPDESTAEPTATPSEEPAETQPSNVPEQDPEPAEQLLPEDGSYTTKEDVCLYLVQYGHLPGNFMTKKEAKELGWEGGSLEAYAPGKCIGGDHFGNYEGLLPDAKGRSWTECDIDTLGAKSRGAKRIIFSNDGLIYYTEDHYESFTLLYGGTE